MGTDGGGEGNKRTSEFYIILCACCEREQACSIPPKRPRLPAAIRPYRMR